MFTNFSKPGNDTPDDQADDVGLHGIGVASESRLPFAVAGRAAPLFTATDWEGAGTPRLRGGILSIVRSTARAFPPSDFSRGGGGRGWAGKRTKVPSCVTTSRYITRLRPKLLVTKRSQLVFPSLARYFRDRKALRINLHGRREVEYA